MIINGLWCSTPREPDRLIGVTNSWLFLTKRSWSTIHFPTSWIFDYQPTTKEKPTLQLSSCWWWKLQPCSAWYQDWQIYIFGKWTPEPDITPQWVKTQRFVTQFPLHLRSMGTTGWSPEDWESSSLAPGMHCWVVGEGAIRGPREFPTDLWADELRIHQSSLSQQIPTLTIVKLTSDDSQFHKLLELTTGISLPVV